MMKQRTGTEPSFEPNVCPRTVTSITASVDENTFAPFGKFNELLGNLVGATLTAHVTGLDTAQANLVPKGLLL
jgi:hypothetical protein